MTIKPIKTKRDYRKTLKELDKPWDAKPNTAEGESLLALAQVVKSNR